MSVITRADSDTALVLISPEALQEMAGDDHAERPERVNGTHRHPDCPHCDEDGQV